jgi:hypothetical protein
VAARRSGERVAVTVRRGGRERELQVTLGTQPRRQATTRRPAPPFPFPQPAPPDQRPGR